jgi:hypothetical protein
VLVGEELADQEQALDRRARVGEDLEVGAPLVGGEEPGDLVKVLAFEPRMLRARLEPDAVPVALVDEAPVAVALALQPSSVTPSPGSWGTAIDPSSISTALVRTSSTCSG